MNRFSMLTALSFGWRVNTACTIIEAMVSWIARSSVSTCSNGYDPREPLESRPATPTSGYLQVAAVTQVEADRNTRLGQRGPHRIMEGIAQRPRLDQTGHRRRPHQYQLRAAPQHELHLFESLGRIGQRKMIGAAITRWSGRSKTPILVQPLVVERMHDAIVASTSCFSASSDAARKTSGNMNTVSMPGCPSP